MNHHLTRALASSHRIPLAAPRVLVLISLLAGGCSGASARPWHPPPVEAIPIPPGPEPPPLTAPTQTSPPPPPSAPTSSPISGELPGDIVTTLSAHENCPVTRCVHSGFYPEAAHVDKRAPAALWSYDIPHKGTEAKFPKRQSADLYGVCVRGELKLAPDEQPTATKKLLPWTAFRAPGVGISLKATKDDTRLVLALVSSSEPITESVAKGNADVWTKRASPIETTDLTHASDLTWAGGAMHARIGFEGDNQRASLGVLMASPDTPVAQHTHDTSWEILGVLRGQGTAKKADAPGVTDLASVAVRDGTVVMMPKGALHAWEPGHQKPLIAIQLYVPPGPEQRFKKLAQPAATPQ